MFCTECGQKNEDNAEFCISCGKPLAEDNTVVNNQPDRLTTAATSSINNSGQGKTAALPSQLKGWNWGAFFLTWIWGIGNNTLIALLSFVPFVNFIMPFVLGAKGNEWAWQNKKWNSAEHFKQVQKKWAFWGLILFLLFLLFIIISIISVIGTDPYYY